MLVVWRHFYFTSLVLTIWRLGKNVTKMSAPDTGQFLVRMFELYSYSRYSLYTFIHYILLFSGSRYTEIYLSSLRVCNVSIFLT